MTEQEEERAEAEEQRHRRLDLTWLERWWSIGEAEERRVVCWSPWHQYGPS